MDGEDVGVNEVVVDEWVDEGSAADEPKIKLGFGFREMCGVDAVLRFEVMDVIDDGLICESNIVRMGIMIGGVVGEDDGLLGGVWVWAEGEDLVVGFAAEQESVDVFVERGVVVILICEEPIDGAVG